MIVTTSPARTRDGPITPTDTIEGGIGSTRTSLDTTVADPALPAKSIMAKDIVSAADGSEDDTVYVN